jgi:hypothetical protein
MYGFDKAGKIVASVYAPQRGIAGTLQSQFKPYLRSGLAANALRLYTRSSKRRIDAPDTTGYPVKALLVKAVRAGAYARSYNTGEPFDLRKYALKLFHRAIRVGK